MAKIGLAILTVAAFLYALWLVVLRRRLPDPRTVTGLRKRFVLATLLFVGLLTTGTARGESVIMCYEMALPYDASALADAQPVQADVVRTLRAVWKTLDAESGEALCTRLEAAAEYGLIRQRTGHLLAAAYDELAWHQERMKATCYRPTTWGAKLQKTRAQVLQQIRLLGQASQAGTIDAETARKAHATLARDLEMLERIRALRTSRQWDQMESLVARYEADEIQASDASKTAARLIFEMQGVPVPDLVPARRFTRMREQVTELLVNGPVGNDWKDPAIRPNVMETLKKTGLLGQRLVPTMLCYSRAAVPVEERGEEIADLQKQLLDKNVRAGVLDVEVARKAAVASQPSEDVWSDAGLEPPESGKQAETDRLIEKEIYAYQRKVRRIVRLLYREGEMPSSFVRELERAADVDIVSFDTAKVLPYDARYYLRSVLWGPVGHEVLRRLEKRKLLPAARNHRYIFDYRGRRDLSDEQIQQLARFEALLDGEEAIELPGDEAVTIEREKLPDVAIDYRLKMRRAVRALVHVGLVSAETIEHVEDTIGIPIVGTIESEPAR